jgi:hypothetical protein
MLTCRESQTLKLIDYIRKAERDSTIGEAAKALKYSVRHIHSLADECADISVGVALSMMGAACRIERVQDYRLELLIA